MKYSKIDLYLFDDEKLAEEFKSKHKNSEIINYKIEPWDFNDINDYKNKVNSEKIYYSYKCNYVKIIKI